MSVPCDLNQLRGAAQVTAEGVGALERKEKMGLYSCLNSQLKGMPEKKREYDRIRSLPYLFRPICVFEHLCIFVLFLT